MSSSDDALRGSPFERAVDAVLAGDVEALRAMLAADPASAVLGATVRLDAGAGSWGGARAGASEGGSVGRSRWVIGWRR